MMETIKVNGKDYSLDALSDEAMALVRNIRVCESEILRHEAQMAIVKTARVAYSRALEQLINSATITSGSSKSN
jgi:hypothetical protein